MRTKKMVKRTAIGCGGLVGLFILIGIIGAIFPNHGNAAQIISTPTATLAAVLTINTPTQAPTIQPTVKVTTAPTHTATAQQTRSTQIVATFGTAVLGATLGDFVGRYGQPNQYSMPQSSMYFFSIYGNNKDDITVTQLDGKHVDAISLDSPTDQGWSLADAKLHCKGFLPSDSVYKRTMTILDASGTPTVQDVYVSPSLAKLFPASDFTDENGNQTTAGTIGMTYVGISNTSSNFLICGPQVGLQQQ